MKKHKSYLILFMLVSIILIFYLISIVGISKAKFTTEKNVNGFSISTKQTVAKQALIATGSAITLEQVETVPNSAEQPETVVDETIPSLEETPTTETTVEPVEPVPIETEQSEVTVEETIVDPTETAPNVTEQSETVVEETISTVEETVTD